MLSPRTLRIAAAIVVFGPLGVAVVGQGFIWLFPGCNPNPYALGECLVGSYNLAPGLMLATIGGVYIALLGVLVSVPLLIGAFWLSRRQPPTR
jgi:hypothetical protein